MEKFIKHDDYSFVNNIIMYIRYDKDKARVFGMYFI